MNARGTTKTPRTGIPSTSSTSGWDDGRRAGGNCDADRLAGEVAAPWKQGGPVRFRKYDFRNDRLLPEERLPDGRILILEGSYCSLPAIRRYADVRVFVTASWETRLKRLRERESPQFLQGFFDRWIPLEDRYFEAYGLPDPECVLLSAPDDGFFPHPGR